MLADAVNGTTGVVETRASYPSGLTIAGVASNASITVSAHTRQYASLAKPVQAGTVTGLTYGTTYYVYYDDLKRAGACLLRRHNDAHGRLLLAHQSRPPLHSGRVTMPEAPLATPATGTPAYMLQSVQIAIERKPGLFGRRWPPIRHARPFMELRRKRWMYGGPAHRPALWRRNTAAFSLPASGCVWPGGWNCTPSLPPEGGRGGS